MTGPVLRPFRAEDVAAVYDVCLRTGLEGEDATGHYADPDLLGHLWAGPFLAIEPEHCLVVEDDDGVAGYCLATVDTRRFEAACEEQWWPALRTRHDDPPDGDRGTWSPDEASVIKQVDRVEAIRSHMNKMRTLMLLRMRQILSPEQRVKLNQKYEQWEKDHRRDGRGKH